MKKKAIIIANSSWGLFNFRLRLIKALQAEGIEVIAIASKDEYSSKLPCRFIPLCFNSSGLNPFDDLKLIFQMLRLFYKIKPDVSLHFTIKANIYGAIVAKLVGVPSILNISGLGTAFINENIISKLARLLYRISLPLSSVTFFQNPDDRNYFCNLGLVDPGKSKLLPGSGVDLVRFSPVCKVRDTKKIIFLQISRVIRDKGVLEFIDAARIISRKKYNVEFRLLGKAGVNNSTAISENEVKEWVSEGIINYLGHKDDVIPHIADADCVILPSYREGTPRSLLEAASMGKPLITTNVPGCKEVVDDGYNGYLSEVKSSDNLALQLEKFINLSEEEVKKMGENSRRKMVQSFDELIVIDSYIDMINVV
jgi:glycosyltransferase involved in cell wall biosynthesis